MAIKGEIKKYAFVTASDFSAKQYYAVTINTSGYATLAGAGGDVRGIMVDAVVSGAVGGVCLSGNCWAKAGASVVAGNFLKADAAGKLVPATTNLDKVVGYSLDNGATDDLINVFVHPIQLSL